MSNAHWELQKAVCDRLTARAELTAILGGPHVWDHVPRGAAFPYITFGVSTEQDWSTGTEAGGEHILTLHVWSRAAGRHEAEAIIAEIRIALHDASLGLAEHHLVNLRVEFAEARRDAERELYHGIVRLRAVTEPTT